MKYEDEKKKKKQTFFGGKNVNKIFSVIIYLEWLTVASAPTAMGRHE